jgi:YD repeat-containing protein
MIRTLRAFWMVCCLSALGSGISIAKPIGGEPPPCGHCCSTCSQSTPDTPASHGRCSSVGRCGGGSCGASVSMGKIGDSYAVFSASASNGVGMDLALTYSSYNADGEKATLSTTTGFGWSHSYNILLFQQGRDLFKQSPSGRTTRYQRAGRRGSLTATRANQQTVTENPDGSIDIANNDQLTFHFEKIPGNPVRVAGQEPWMLTRITDRNSNQTTLTYAGGLLRAVQDTYGRQLSFDYDSQNRVHKITDPISRVTELDYDGAGNLTTIKDPLGQETRYQYNVRHQIVGRIDRNGRRWRFLYDADAHPVGIRDADDHAVFSMTNSSGWATNLTDLYRNKQRSYVPSTTTLTDGRGNQWLYDYDKDGLITRITAPDGATTTYTYDPATLSMATETDANGNTTSYEYDSRNNLTKETDALGNVTLYEYDPVFNQMTKMTKYRGATVVHSVTEYQYDAHGNRIKETRDVGSLNLVREWAYDVHGNVLTETDANGHVTTNEYDADGNLVKVTDAEGHVTTHFYDKSGVPNYAALGLRTRTTDANGHTTTFDYDDLDRLVMETDPLGFATSYQYDGVGNRIEMQRQVAQPPPCHLPGHTLRVRQQRPLGTRDP